MTNYSKTVKALSGYYLQTLDHPGPAELFEFSFGSGEPEIAATVSVVRLSLAGPDETFYFTGTVASSRSATHSHHFIGIYDSADPAFSEVVASALHFDCAIERLGYGHTFPLGGNSVLRRCGMVAALILDAGVYAPFNESSPFGGSAIFSVVLLSAGELERKRQTGLDGLFEIWDKTGRDILHVTSPTIV